MPQRDAPGPQTLDYVSAAPPAPTPSRLVMANAWFFVCVVGAVIFMCVVDIVHTRHRDTILGAAMVLPILAMAAVFQYRAVFHRRSLDAKIVVNLLFVMAGLVALFALGTILIPAMMRMEQIASAITCVYLIASGWLNRNWRDVLTRGEQRRA